MPTMNLTIDGAEYVAVPKAEYLRLIGADADDSAIDAVSFARASIGRSLKAARDHAGLTQAELAKKVKKAQATVSGSESGKIQVSARYVAKVLKACGLPEGWKAENSLISKADPSFRSYLRDDVSPSEAVSVAGALAARKQTSMTAK